MRTPLSAAAPGRATAKLSLNLLVGVGFLTLATLAGTGQSLATTPNVLALKKHFIECLNLLLTDPAKHAQLCGPSRVPYILETLAPAGSPAAVIIAAVIEEEDEDVDEGEGDDEGDDELCDWKDSYREKPQ